MYDFITISFGERVRRRRKALDLTQAQLGQRAGCSAAAIRKIEAEERRPSAQLAELLARALELPQPERETFLRAARGLAAPSLAANPAEASAAYVTTPNNLPSPLTSFVNRTRDIATVTRLLGTPDVRLLTLIGPPGIGKTRLGIQAVELLLPDFPGGVWFVDLAPVTDPARVLPAIAHCVRLYELADEPMLDRLKGFWGEQRVLLLLDNFEHVVEAAPEVSGLLRACRGLKVLATSRTPLRVYGEHEYLAPPLALPPAGLPAGQLVDYEAVQLFVTRVRQHQPGFDVDADSAPDVQEILQKLDGIPLAIELAAATLRRLPVAGLAEVLRGQDWVRSLEAQAQDLPPRQRTLANAIVWSYNRLDPLSRVCLGRLAVFAGTFSREAALAVCAGLAAGADGEDAEIGSALATLEENGLLAPASHGWRLLEMIRAFAWDRLPVEQRAIASRRHATYFCDLIALEAANPERIERVYNDCVAGLKWLIAQQDLANVLTMAGGLAWFWETRGYVREGEALIREVLALPGESAPHQRLDLLFKAANLAWQCHDFTGASEFAEAGIALARAGGLDDELAALRNLLGRAHLEAGDYDRAEADLLRARELAAGAGARLDVGFPILQLAEVAWARGDIERAQALLEEAEELLPRREPDLAWAMLRTDSAELALGRGDAAAARRELTRALPHARSHVRRLRFWLVTCAGLLLAEGWLHAAGLAAQCLAVEHGLGQHGAPLSPCYRPLLDARQTQVRALLGEDAVRPLWAAARGWSIAQAVAFVESLVAADRLIPDASQMSH